MRSESFRCAGAAAVSAALLMGLHGAQADPEEVEPTQSGVYFVTDPNHGIGTKHWEVFSDHGITAASVMASSRNDMLDLNCDAHEKSIALTITPRQRLNSAMETRQLLLVFDRQPPIKFGWAASRVTDEIFEFRLTETDTDFSRLLQAFRTHHSFTAIVRDTSGEVRRDDFALAAAGPSIDFVFAACGKAVRD